MVYHAVRNVLSNDYIRSLQIGCILQFSREHFLMIWRKLDGMFLIPFGFCRVKRSRHAYTHRALLKESIDVLQASLFLQGDFFLRVEKKRCFADRLENEFRETLTCVGWQLGVTGKFWHSLRGERLAFAKQYISHWHSLSLGDASLVSLFHWIYQKNAGTREYPRWFNVCSDTEKIQLSPSAFLCECYTQPLADLRTRD